MRPDICQASTTFVLPHVFRLLTPEGPRGHQQKLIRRLSFKCNTYIDSMAPTEQRYVIQRERMWSQHRFVLTTGDQCWYFLLLNVTGLLNHPPTRAVDGYQRISGRNYQFSSLRNGE